MMHLPQTVSGRFQQGREAPENSKHTGLRWGRGSLANAPDSREPSKEHLITVTGIWTKQFDTLLHLAILIISFKAKISRPLGAKS